MSPRPRTPGSKHHVLAAGRTSSAEFGETSCTPGYYNNEGSRRAKSRQGGFYFGGPTEFAEILEAWRSEGSLAGLVAEIASGSREAAGDPEVTWDGP